jgi:multimeric flavodoxin WrbA
MKVVIVYSNSRKGSTYNCVQVVKETMGAYGNVIFQDVYLDKELPKFCNGCFNCINNGETKCPHFEYTEPIVNSLINADAIVLASPVYALDVSGQMKSFLDHLCFMWMSHRPNKDMFSKIGFVISTSAGSGTRRTNKTMKTALDFMGIKRTYCYGSAVAACSWERVKEDKKIKIRNKLVKKTNNFYKAINNRKKLPSRIFTKLLFSMMKGMTKGFEDGHIDKEYWRKMGWYDNVKPYKFMK